MLKNASEQNEMVVLSMDGDVVQEKKAGVSPSTRFDIQMCSE